jgi:hypothetical protein
MRYHCDESFGAVVAVGTADEQLEVGVGGLAHGLGWLNDHGYWAAARLCDHSAQRWSRVKSQGVKVARADLTARTERVPLPHSEPECRPGHIDRCLRRS